MVAWHKRLEPIAALADVLTRELRSAVEWWLTGLLAPLPEAWRRRVAVRYGRLLLERQAGQWVATWMTGIPLQSAAASVQLAPDETFDVARQTLGVPSAARATLLLDQDAVLHRRLSLPAAAKSVLDDVVRNEIERLTPIPKQDLALRYRVARHDRIQKRVLVDAFVARASNVEASAAQWTRRGWVIERITFRGATTVEPTIDFLPRRRWGTQRVSVPMPRWSVAVAALAAAVALYAPGIHYARLREAHASELSALRATAVAARETLTRRDQLLERDRFLAEQRTGRAPTLAVLAELTSILPDDTWLQQLHLRDGRVQLQGDSASASTVVQLLEQSPVFAEAEFAAPISSGSDASRERFVVDVAIAPHQAP